MCLVNINEMGGCIKVRFVKFEELKEEMDVLKKDPTVSKSNS